MPDRDTVKTVMRHETWRDMETRDRAKTRHTSVDTESPPRREKLCRETVAIQDTTCLETPSLMIQTMIQTHTHTHRIDYSTWATKVVRNERILQQTSLWPQRKTFWCLWPGTIEVWEQQYCDRNQERNWYWVSSVVYCCLLLVWGLRAWKYACNAGITLWRTNRPHCLRVCTLYRKFRFWAYA